MLSTSDHAGKVVGGARRALIFLGIAAALLQGCQSPRSKLDSEVKILETDPLSDPNQEVARVNDHVITRGEYYRRILNKFGTTRMLRGMINEELFVQEAKKRGISPTPEEVKAQVDDQIAQEAAMAGGKDKLEEIYRSRGIRIEDLRQEYGRDSEMHLLIGKVTKSFRKIDDETVRGYYQVTYAKTRYRVRHIAYRFPLNGLPEWDLGRRKIEAREKADRTAKRIRGGADFAQIARQESEEEETRLKGGDLGYFPEDQEMDPLMKETILKLKPMEVSDPVENNLLGAYHVVQVTEVVPHKSYGECEPQMKKELAERDPDDREIRDVLERLEQSAAVLRVFGLDADRPPVEASRKDRKG